MTSQLTPERTTSSSVNNIETSERPLILQPWFVMAILSLVAIVLVILSA
jgi:hypothetical protein